MKKLKILASFVIATFVISFFTCCSGGSANTPGNSITNTYDLLKNKEFEKVSKMYVSREGEKLSEAETKKMEGLAAYAYEEHEKKDGIKNIEINEETISEDGNSAKVKFTIHFKNGDTENENGNLIKTDGKWFLKL